MQSLKTLQRNKKELKEDLYNLNREVNQLNKRIKEKMDKLDRVDDLIHQQTQDIKVSEHAVLRYVERVLKVDTDAIRNALLPDKVKEQALRLGSGTYPISNGILKIVIKDNVVTTCLTKDINEY